MELKALLQFLPEKDLEFLAAETNVDFQVKKKRSRAFRLCAVKQTIQ